MVSAFNPAIIADMQRARMLSWELPKLGWEVEVLTPRASEVRQDILEQHAESFFAPTVRVHEVGSVARRALTMLGSRTHAWRTLWPMLQRGTELISSNRFDLIYFTTTTFVYFTLGARWRRKYKMPYILDFHDPWLRTDGAQHKKQSWKSRLVKWLSVLMEHLAVTNADGIVAVSPQYMETLQLRYQAYRPAWLKAGRHAVIPFGALERDLVKAERVVGGTEKPSSDEFAIHYVGAGGSIMVRSFTLICETLALLRSQGDPLVNRIAVRLFGTTYDWQPGDPKQLEMVARKAGIGDLVAEMPERVSYRRSLELLLKGDGALILGVDDTGYMPSKLFSYALSGKPLLTSLRRDSPAFTLFQDTPELGHALWLDSSGDMPLADAAKVVRAFLQEVAARRSFDRRAILEPFLAPAMAFRHVKLFEECLSDRL